MLSDFVNTLGMVYSYNDPSTELGQFHEVKAGLRLNVEFYKKLNRGEAQKTEDRVNV